MVRKYINNDDQLVLGICLKKVCAPQWQTSNNYRNPVSYCNLVSWTNKSALTRLFEGHKLPCNLDINVGQHTKLERVSQCYFSTFRRRHVEGEVQDTLFLFFCCVETGSCFTTGRPFQAGGSTSTGCSQTVWLSLWSVSPIAWALKFFQADHREGETPAEPSTTFKSAFN